MSDALPIEPRPRARLLWPAFVLVSAAAVAALVFGVLNAGTVAERDVSSALERLPRFHAALNAASGTLLLAGFAFIKMRWVRAHVACMLLAPAATLVFLVSYLYYHFHVGSVPFRGTGGIRAVYFAVLASHTILAALVVPLAGTVIYLAARGRFDQHKRLARWTLPIWLYVSFSGVWIYFMVYVWFAPR